MKEAESELQLMELKNGKLKNTLISLQVLLLFFFFIASGSGIR
jgi:hypothetical protein